MDAEERRKQAEEQIRFALHFGLSPLSNDYGRLVMLARAYNIRIPVRKVVQDWTNGDTVTTVEEVTFPEQEK